ncbi:ribonuclease Z [Lolliginicoccus suaedae]|uniref:ribonuclease Z n=1 Tax=Lolliginicoccus suaedae TaxID=2605429 RepID=UPI0011EEB4A6|nr:ribonuclease Z [Lolliginicoccus suaedae]
MSPRELVILGTASAVPTRQRNHNGYFLRWGRSGVLFDPGEGTQRQMSHAGISAHDINQVCITHFHGDHCLGLPGIIQRIARDGVPHEVTVAYPAAGEQYYQRLRWASEFHPTDRIRPHPLEGAEPAGFGEPRMSALPLVHSTPVYGYRIAEPDGVHMHAEELAAIGVTGPRVGRLKQQGHLKLESGRIIELEDFSTPRRGASLAFVMDTGWCDNAIALAREADTLVIEATFLSAEEDIAARYRHLTARQAGRIAALAGARRLVLTHFSQRYGLGGMQAFEDEARGEFDGPIHIARDLDVIAL